MATQQRPTKQDVIALERSYWDAMQRKDGSRTAELSAEGALVTGSHGVMNVSRKKMGSMTEEGDWTLESYEFEDVEVSVPMPDVAIVAYTVRQNVTIGGKAQEMRAADSSVWVRGPEGWRCHAHSEAFLKDGART